MVSDMNYFLGQKNNTFIGVCLWVFVPFITIVHKLSIEVL